MIFSGNNGSGLKDRLEELPGALFLRVEEDDRPPLAPGFGRSYDLSRFKKWIRTARSARAIPPKTQVMVRSVVIPFMAIITVIPPMATAITAQSVITVGKKK